MSSVNPTVRRREKETDNESEGARRTMNPLDSISDVLDRLAIEAALLGLRQLWHAVQGVRSRASPETRTRRWPTQRRCIASPAWRLPSRSISPGTWSTTSTSWLGTLRTCGVRLGTINTNTFQDDDYKLGSFCHVDARVRAKAVRHAVDCIDIMDATGSRDLKIWLPDGLNYPGQADLRDRQERLADSLAQVYARLGD